MAGREAPRALHMAAASAVLAAAIYDAEILNTAHETMPLFCTMVFLDPTTVVL